MSKRWVHYCCRHSLPGILKDGGLLRPNPQTGFQPRVAAKARELGFDLEENAYVWPLVWVTDIDVRTRRDAMAIGLGQLEGNLTECFRVEFRFIVPNVGLVPWTKWADENVTDPRQVHVRELLEDREFGAVPEHWWVSAKPIGGCRLDQRYWAAAEGLE